MAGMMGFEPTPDRVQSRYSDQTELHPHAELTWRRREDRGLCSLPLVAPLLFLGGARHECLRPLLFTAKPPIPLFSRYNGTALGAATAELFGHPFREGLDPPVNVNLVPGGWPALLALSVRFEAHRQAR